MKIVEFIFIVLITIGVAMLIFAITVLEFVQPLTSDTMYIKTTCVDGNYNVNLEGLSCEKKVYCNGIPSFLDNKECDKAYYPSKLEESK